MAYSSVLRGVSVHGRINDFMADVTVVQSYVNEEKVNVEAVYTFPLPADAVLLSFAAVIDGRRLVAGVRPSLDAEEEYEEAVERGDAAVRLEKIDGGMYTVSAGNLLPGQTCEIEFRYGQFNVWNGDRLRFRFPTVIGERYGQYALRPHQVPQTDRNAAYPLVMNLQLEGGMAECSAACPTHRMEKTADGTLRICGELDRDAVLNIQAGKRGTVLRCAQDGDGSMLALAVHAPKGEGPAAPRTVHLVVDCSGSMNGERMQQAKEALRLILGMLRPEDRFNITRFGSTHVTWSPEGYAPADTQTLERAKAFVRGISADLGGTEMYAALHPVLRSHTGRGSEDAASRPAVLLITDGDIADRERIVREAKASACRIFTVGVGSAVSEDVVRDLAEATGGACEMVTPNEDMAERIVRHFERMDAVSTEISIKWPLAPKWVWPAGAVHVFPGDTAYVFAACGRQPEGSVQCEGQAFEIGACEEDERVLARMAVGRRLQHGEDRENGEPLAVEYQLISPWTDYILVDEREEKAEGLPELRTVGQMHAAGQFGIGAACAEACAADIVHAKLFACFSSPAPAPAPGLMKRMASLFGRTFGASRTSERCDDVCCECAPPDASPDAVSLDEYCSSDGFDAFIRLLDGEYAAHGSPMPITAERLRQWKLAEDLVSFVEETAEKFGVSLEDVLCIVLNERIQHIKENCARAFSEHVRKTCLRIPREKRAAIRGSLPKTLYEV